LEILIYIITAVQAYIIGGVNGAIIASKYLYRRDIRELGSGNPGLTNFYRVFGKRGAALMIIIDVAKTLGPVLIGGLLFSRFLHSGLSGRIFAGFFVMLGHAFPLFYNFKGGKTVLAIGVLLFSIDWRVTLLGWGIFVVVLLATRYVSLGAVVGVWGYPIALALFRVGTGRDLVIAILCALLLVVRHSANIKRLINHKESKLKLHRGGRSK
jgi:glycerol-3-phosphate acyltransferase PlsY